MASPNSQSRNTCGCSTRCMGCPTPSCGHPTLSANASVHRPARACHRRVPGQSSCAARMYRKSGAMKIGGARLSVYRRPDRGAAGGGPYDGTERVASILGSGSGLSLNQVLDGIEQVTQKKAARRYLAARAFDVPASNVLWPLAQRRARDGHPPHPFSKVWRAPPAGWNARASRAHKCAPTCPRA